MRSRRWRICSCRSSVGARVVFLSPVSSTTLLEALRDARHHDLRVRAAVLLSDSPARDGRGRASAAALARGLVRAIVGANVWLRDRAGANPGKRVFARVHRVFGTKMRFLVTGGSKFDPAIGRDLYGMGFTLLNAYGLTETSGAATLMRPGDRFTTSVGQPLPGVEIRIAERRRLREPDDRSTTASADPRRRRHARVLRARGRDGGVNQGRLALHRRPRPARRRRPALHHRPLERDHRPRLRQESLSGRDRSALPPVAVHQGAVRARPEPAGRAGGRAAARGDRAG